MANKGELALGQEVTLPESADELVEFAERLAHRALQSERAEASSARAELETERAGRERAQRERDALVEEVKRLHDENAELLSVRERVMQTLSSVQHPSSANSSDTSSRRPSAREFNSPDERVNSILASVQRSDSAAAAAAAAADANGADDDQNADRKNIGKIFFTEARQRMDSDDWQIFLSDIKELQSHNQPKDHVLNRWKDRFSELNMDDLFKKFEELLEKTHPSNP